MNTKTSLLTLGLCFAAGTVCFASPMMGTWKLNEAKSKLDPGSRKNVTVVYAAAGDDIKVTVDGTDGAGNATHNEWTGKFNGKCSAVTGDPTADQRCYKTLNSRTLRLTGKKGGKVTVSGTIVVSANGKVRTVTTSGLDAKGKRFRSVAVYDKE